MNIVQHQIIQHKNSTVVQRQQGRKEMVFCGGQNYTEEMNKNIVAPDKKKKA